MIGLPTSIYGAIGALRSGRDSGWAWGALVVALAGIALLAAVLLGPLVRMSE